MKNRKLWISLTATLVCIAGISAVLILQSRPDQNDPTPHPALLQEQTTDTQSEAPALNTNAVDTSTVPPTSVPVTTEQTQTQPELSFPEESEPTGSKPDISDSQDTASKKDSSSAAKQEASKPKPKPAENKPEETVPKATQPDPTEPTKTTEPPATEPKATEPEITEPKPTEPEVTEPKPTEPEVTEPKPTEPEVTEPKPTEPEVTEPDPTEPPKPERQEPKAKNFTVYDANGNPVKLSAYIGKPIVLNFWASWCGPCKWEMPGFQQLYQELGDQVQFLMVNLTGYDDMASANALIAQYGYTFPVLFDTTLEAAGTYGVTAFPTTVFIDREGYLMEQYVGAMDEETLRHKMDLIR